MKLRAFIFGATLLGLSGTARAEDPVSLGAFEDWEAFIYHSDGAAVCYALSAPKKQDSDKKISHRDPVHFMVTHFAGRKVKGQISTIIGYPFKEQSTVVLKVDDKNFDLYTNGDTAWAASGDVEAAIVKAMKTAKGMSVTGTSVRGTTTTDSYSLAGLNKALEKIDVACK
jgi:Trk-type K+ transport system membrane component